MIAAGVVLLALPAGASAQKVKPEFFGTIAVQPEVGDFREMQRVGVGSYRVPVSWRAIQHTRNGGYNWNGPDRHFRRAANHGLKPVPVLFGSPKFIGREGRMRPPVRSKRNRQAWRAFVEATVNRYGRGGTFWQPQDPEILDPLASTQASPSARPATDWIIWNEQNARPFWRPEARPGEYATLIRISRRAINAADPQGRLVTGGMYGYPNHRKSMSAREFLRRLYARKGMRAAIDGVALHPYAGGLKGVRRQIRQMRKVVRRAGAGNVSLWIGEIGWASAGDRKNALVKNRRQQARLLNRSMRMLINNQGRWRVRAAFWFVWRDYGSDPHCPCCPRAGLMTRGGDRKPAARTYRQLINRHR
jgi:hypothetical protein